MLADNMSIMSPAPQVEERLNLAPWAAGLGVLCLIPLAMMALGFQFASFTDGLATGTVGAMTKGELSEHAFHALRGSYTHTLLEWTALCTAIFVCVLAFVQYKLSGESALPILGVALLCSGAIDAFHTFAADRLITAVASNKGLIPFTWAICRLFNGCILLVGALIVMGTRRGEPTGRKNGMIALVSLVFVLTGYAIISYCANSGSLPQTMFPDATITRPFDIYPIIPYVLVAGIFYVHFHRKNASIFGSAMLLSLVPAIATQLYMAFGSMRRGAEIALHA